MSQTSINIDRMYKTAELLNKANDYLQNSLKAIDIPNDFNYATELKNIESNIEECSEDIIHLKDNLLSIANEWIQAEAKNQEIIKQFISGLTKNGIDYFNKGEYSWAETVGRKVGQGIYIESNEIYLYGNYSIPDKGRNFRLFDQFNDGFGGKWGEHCNLIANLTVVSGVSNETSENLVNDISQYTGEKNAILPNSYYNKYGLERDDGHQFMLTEEYTEALRDHFQKENGVAALIYVAVPEGEDGSRPPYVGKSGREWTQEGDGRHWVAAIDYIPSEVEGEVDKIVLADSGVIDTYDIDEFNYGIGYITNMVCISELPENKMRENETPKMQES